MAGHTPGPWHLIAPKLPRYPLQLLEIRAKDGAVVHWGGFDASDFGKTERKANARLIVAAPDLLDAARAALSVLEVVMGNDVMAVRQQLRAAITKATT